MGETRFDTLTRSLTHSRSRRGLTHLLGGLTLGGPFVLLGVAGTAAKPKKKKKSKKKRSSPAPPVSPPPPSGCTASCAGKACGADDGCGTPCQTGSCPTGQTCQSGQCVSSGCPAGTRDCGGGVCQECCFGQTNSDYHCCPPEYPNCHDSTVYFGINRSCTAGGVCRCPETYPTECTISGLRGTCHQCCEDAHCIQKFDDPNRICFFGNCGCQKDWTTCYDQQKQKSLCTYAPGGSCPPPG